MNIVIETDRLVLRTFTENDAELIYDLNKDPEITRYTLDPMPTLEKARSVLLEVILPQYVLYNHGRWAVHTKPGLEFIGWCGLKNRPELQEVDLGYRFMKNDWGKGYATEAAFASLEHGFSKLNLREITGRAMVENLASIRVLEKCGMQYIGEEFVEGALHKTYRSFNPAIL